MLPYSSMSVLQIKNEKFEPLLGELKTLPASGLLQDMPARHLIEQIHRQSFSGTLILRHRDKKKKLWFYKGDIFRIQSNLVPELIGRMMVDRGWINEADLRACLKIQQDFTDQGVSSKRIGELVSEVYGLDEDELQSLVDHQSINSFLQAMTWDTGEFEISSLEFRNKPEALFEMKEVIQSLHSLFEVNPRHIGNIFEQTEAWHPDSQQTDLSRVPLWSILAGCRRLALSGIISVRRQNKLYEIVIKYGVPLTLYEGSFGQPRQTIVVRQASEDHERFFIEQLYKLFSFLTGTVYFRSLSDSRSSSKDHDSHLQFRDETAVTKSVRPVETSEFELHPDLLIQKNFWKQVFLYLESKVSHWILRLRRLIRI